MSSKNFMSSISDAASNAASDVTKSIESGVNNLKKTATTAYYDFVGRGNQGRGRVGAPTAAELNAYSHKNTVEKKEYLLDFLINELDNYDAYTYHWKLFITSTDNARSGKVLKLENQVIVAESGVSDLTIDKVELNGIAVPSSEAGTGTQTLVKFEIVEPSGAALLDKLFYQATALGIGNWLVMPCFLQLEFRGRDQETSNVPEEGAPGGLAALKWIWPIKLTNSKAHVTHVGTRYEFDAIIYDELAQSNSYFAIQHNTVLSNLSKFSDAMKDLENKLNNDQYEKLIDNYSIPDTYKIVVDPDLANIDIIQPEDNTSTAFGRSFIDFDKKTASFNPGTGIDKIVDAILGNTKHFQEKLKGSETADSMPGTANTVPTQMKRLWRVVTETRPIAFDMLRQDNAVEITIFISEYKLGVADANASQTGQTPDTLPAAKKRFEEYSKTLRKKYNYIFTGLNDQITNVDLNMNFSFAASLSRFGGAYYDSALKMTGVALDARKDADTKVTEQVRNVIHFVNNAKPNDAEIDKKIKSAIAALNNKDLDPVLAARYKVLLEHAKPASRTAFTEELKVNGGLTASGGFTNQPIEVLDAKDGLVNQAKTAKYLSEPNNGLRFISDVDVSSPSAKAAYEVAKANRKGKLRPIPYRESQNEIANSSGIDPASNSGRAQLASVFSTALYSTLDASLQSIKLTIKGDPYWLFPRPVGGEVDTLMYKSNMDVQDAFNIIKSTGDSTSVNFFGSDNFIVVRFRTPRIYNTTAEQETGVDPYTEVETFSGVYKVITVVSKFEMGKFTQELSCILDPMINLVDFLKDIEEDAKKVTTSSTSISSTIPISSIKNPSKLATNYLGGAGFSAIDPRRLDLPNTDTIQEFVKSGPGGGGSSTVDTTISGIRSNIPPYLRN